MTMDIIPPAVNSHSNRRSLCDFAMIISRRLLTFTGRNQAIRAALSLRLPRSSCATSSLPPTPAQPSEIFLSTSTDADGKRTEPMTSTESTKQPTTKSDGDHHVSDHYLGHDAASYESAFFYEPGAYAEYLCQLVVDTLQLNDDHVKAQSKGGDSVKRRLLDIGGGTGNFTRMLLPSEENSSSLQAIVVDPFLKPKDLESSNNSSNLQFVSAPAEDFLKTLPAETSSSAKEDDAWWRRDFHQVLLKEVVHHLADDDRVDIYKGMRRGILPLSLPASDEDASSHVPALLIITRPQTDVDYPLWPAARQVWADNQPSAASMEQELRDAGFSQVQSAVHVYPCTIALSKWQRMVRQRFWSTFAHFTDQELEQACAYLAENEQHRMDAQGNIQFEDRLVFITACL